MSTFEVLVMLMKFGRDDARGLHQAAPWPSIAPKPLISMSCKFVAPMNDVVPTQLLRGSICSSASPSTCKAMLLFRAIGPHR